jgi:hypothetical protein
VKSLAVLVLLVASPAFAQRTEVTLLGGYTTAGDIDRKALGIEELKIDGSFTWGLAAGYFLSERIGIEASWTRQQSALVIGTSSGSAELFDITLGLLQGSVVYQLGAADDALRPFALAGLGATFLGATDLEGETKLGLGLGAGVKWFPSGRVGGRVQARYVPTLLSDSDAEVCDPFGFCQGTLHQFELTGGVVVRF